MEKRLINTGKTRFDTRLPVQQKLLLEKAAALGGFSSLSDFILLTAQEKALEIIKEHELIIASQKDSEIFFEAIVNPQKPGKLLTEAAKAFKLWINETENA
jgi:uncharacterized protein (DUF1778 family)